MINTYTLATNIQYGVPSANYDGSSQDFSTLPTKAAGYYQGYGSIQTVTISVTGFVGVIKIQASLNDDIPEALFFDLNQFSNGVAVETGTFPITITGNFVWMKCEIQDFSAGTINSITVSY